MTIPILDIICTLSNTERKLNQAIQNQNENDYRALTIEYDTERQLFLMNLPCEQKAELEFKFPACSWKMPQKGMQYWRGN